MLMTKYCNGCRINKTWSEMCRTKTRGQSDFQRLHQMTLHILSSRAAWRTDRQTYGQTLRSSVTIVCISCIRCSLKMKENISSRFCSSQYVLHFLLYFLILHLWHHFVDFVVYAVHSFIPWFIFVWICMVHLTKKCNPGQEQMARSCSARLLTVSLLICGKGQFFVVMVLERRYSHLWLREHDDDSTMHLCELYWISSISAVLIVIV